MALIIPPNVKNYSAPLNAVPLDWTSPPPEGAKGINCTIAWNVAQAGPNKAVYLNMQNNATLNFSEIRAIVVDNSLNGSDVQVVFPDTELTFTVPAYTPYAVIPVFTNQTQFYMLSPNSLITDKTAFTVMNTMPPPIAVPVTEAQNFVTLAGFDASINGSRILLPATVNGTLENMNLTGFCSDGGGGASFDIFLSDGAGNPLFQGTGGVVALGTTNLGASFQMNDVRLRFSQGLILSWSSAGAPSAFFLAPNIYYRTP
jgi:hypothetical protein